MTPPRSAPAVVPLRLDDPLGTPMRMVLVVLGLVPLLAPWELLVRPQWGAARPWTSVTLALAWALSIGALSVTALLWTSAVGGRSQTVLVDPVARTVTQTLRRPWPSPTQSVHPFEEIRGVVVVRQEWESSTTYRLRFELADGTHLDAGQLEQERAADDQAELLTRWLAAD